MSLPSRAWIGIGSAVIWLGFSVGELHGQVFDFAKQGSSTSVSYGASASSTGDIDKDGCDDFIVGAPLDGSSMNGSAEIVSGATGSTLGTVSSDPSSFFGASVDGRLDSDGDGFNDVIIGAPLWTSSFPQQGLIMIFSPHRNKVLQEHGLDASYANYGFAVRSLESDIDGDGINDYLVGAPGIDGVSVESGATGSLLMFPVGQTGAWFGAAVSRLDDVNGDGLMDFAVGAYQFQETSGNVTGRVTACSGKDGSELWHINGVAKSEFGYALGSPGDLDGDGINDLVVGAPNHDNNKSGASKTGCATILSGVSGTVLYKVFGDNTDDRFGESVRSTHGDIDGDGVADFVVGAPQELISGASGYARTFSGANGKMLFNFLEHTFDPTTQSGYGSAVAGGDFNGDGRTDVVIGGPNFASDTGIAEVWTTAVAEWSNYGAGWPGTFGVPSIWAASNPVVGQALTIEVDNSLRASTFGVVILGVSKASIPTSKGGTILVDPLLILLLPIPRGGLSLTGTIPDDPNLYGFHLYLEALEADSGASNGLSFTAGLDLQFGYQ